MRAVIQRVKRASVSLPEKNGEISGKISAGLLVLLGVENGDTIADAEKLALKIAGLRIFEDSDEKMNLSVRDINGEILVVSQFTLYGNVKKGFRPSFNRSAKPDISMPLYKKFVELIGNAIGKEIPTGVFGAMMDVELLNDGPVTIILDTKLPEF